MNTPTTTLLPAAGENLETRIIKAARALFVEKGYAETSMSDIALRVGINRPVLHYYFRTKERMFQAVFGDIVLSVVPVVMDIIRQREKSVTERVTEVVEAYYALFLSNPRLPMFVIREMNRDATCLLRTAEQLGLPEKLGAILDHLHQEMQTGRLRNVPPRFLFFNLYGLLTIPFLTQDLTHSLFLEQGERFEEMLEKWKPYVISQLVGLLEK